MNVGHYTEAGGRPARRVTTDPEIVPYLPTIGPCKRFVTFQGLHPTPSLTIFEADSRRIPLNSRGNVCDTREKREDKPIKDVLTPEQNSLTSAWKSQPQLLHPTCYDLLNPYTQVAVAVASELSVIRLESAQTALQTFIRVRGQSTRG
jgi:hypothetical protein